MKSLIFLLIAFQFLIRPDAVLSEQTRFEKSAAGKQEIAGRIVWPNHEPLVFYLRRGGMAENWPEIYERQHAPENIQLMADAQVKYGRLHFYKGLGLEMEMPEIRKSMRMSELMHSHGMKVSLYVAGTMFIEPFYREVPEALSWEQRDQNGKWVPYSGTQTFRHFACHNEPAYREYLKKVLRIGVDSVKTDQFFFDNIFVKPEPKSCRCSRCMKAFKEFLRRRYPTSKEVFRRFGYPDVDIIQVNEWDEFNQPYGLATIDDPVLQEWMRFRCESLANHCGELYDYIKSLNPKISVGFNLKGLYGENRYWRAGVYHPLFQGRCDFFCFDTDGMEARLDEETGALVAEIRSYKAGRSLGMSSTSWGRGLEYAVYMAFNHQKYLPGYGYHGGPDDIGASRIFTPLAEFFRAYNDRYFTDTKNIAEVAVLRSWPSMAYSIRQTLVPTILMEQVLIQHKVPFDIIFDEQAETFDRYQAVILPGQESLSRDIIDRLTAYVKKGGTLVFTDNTADYNKWRERRPSNPLLEMLGLDKLPAEITVKKLGQGRLVCIPRVVPGGSSTAAEPGEAVVADATSSTGRPFPSSRWLLPENHQAIHQAIVDNLPRGTAIETGAPLTTVMEIVNREKTRETIVHFVNFDQDHRLEPFRVALKKQYQGRVKSVSLISPESDRPQSLEFEDQPDRITLRVPGMQLYSMVVVKH